MSFHCLHKMLETSEQDVYEKFRHWSRSHFDTLRCMKIFTFGA